MPVLNWIGKESVVKHDKDVPFRLLKKIKPVSVGEKSENLIIHGDNLEVLKALLPYYQEKISVIYIDPPYNTGTQSWIYNDRVDSPKIRQWLKKVVKAEDLTRHDKWLCMIYPRLKLLKELLSESGLIFISIDDNEIHNLREIMDELFGEANFVGQIIVRSNPRGSQEPFGVAAEHEYVLAYSKQPSGRLSIIGEPRDEDDAEFNYTTNDGSPARLLGLRKRGGDWRRSDRPNMYYPLYVNPDTLTVSLEKKTGHTVEVYPLRPDGEESRWTWGEATSKKRLSELVGKRIKRGGEETFDVYRIDPLVDGDGLVKRKKLKSILEDKALNYQNARTYFKELFNDPDRFDFPKPPELIKKLLSSIEGDDYIVLDSFAGSGTTGHAVLDLNKEDGGSRKFIMVELEDDVAKDITAERVKRAIKKYGYKDGFEYCELDKPLFDEGGQIDESCSFKELATYVYFTETQTNIDVGRISGNFIGDTDSTDYYLIYKSKGKNDLTKTLLNKMKKSDKKRVVYADRCLVDEKLLEEHNTVFKQIPYEIKVF
ncbi:MAG: site-specific DNA-methyltransferase [Patescibacteria group bacterium]